MSVFDWFCLINKVYPPNGKIDRGASCAVLLIHASNHQTRTSLLIMEYMVPQICSYSLKKYMCGCLEKENVLDSYAGGVKRSMIKEAP